MSTDHQHDDVDLTMPGAPPREILTWEGFGAASRELAETIRHSGFEPTVLLAIARGGLPVAGALGYALGIKNCMVINV